MHGLPATPPPIRCRVRQPRYQHTQPLCHMRLQPRHHIRTQSIQPLCQMRTQPMCHTWTQSLMYHAPPQPLYYIPPQPLCLVRTHWLAHCCPWPLCLVRTHWLAHCCPWPGVVGGLVQFAGGASLSPGIAAGTRKRTLQCGTYTGEEAFTSMSHRRLMITR